MLDFNDASIDSLPGQEMQSLAAGCRAAASERLGRAPAERVPLRSRLESPIVHEAPKNGGVSIAYLVMAHRAFAHASVGRLIRVLWDRAHLFLLHFDLRANASMIDFLHSKFESAPNIRFMEHRRAVGWGAFSQVSVLLEAMATAFNSPPGFDFFINLSDADVPLRTNAELVSFLGDFRGRSFVSVKFPYADELRYHAHRHMRRSSWLECSGRGFLVINQTAATMFENEQRRCCYARSGPIVYAPLSLGRPAAPDSWEFFHGSQWAILARDAVECARTPAASRQPPSYQPPARAHACVRGGRVGWESVKACMRAMHAPALCLGWQVLAARRECGRLHAAPRAHVHVGRDLPSDGADERAGRSARLARQPQPAVH